MKLRWHTWLSTLATLAALISTLVAPAVVVNAATSTLYLDHATDPHGGIWLTGTTDGTTTGPMDPGTNPASRGFGHLWETDVPSGFCRVDTVQDPNNPAASIQLYARPNAYASAPASGGCITNGQKSSQPMLEPRRNADGTFYVYTCDWAVFSAGCYRMTYDPGAQLMTSSEQLAPGRFPTNGGRGIKPFTTAVGADGNLYVTSDLLPWVYRISSPNAANVGTQTVSIVASSNSGTRVRATTFACWDPNRGGTTGLPTCAQSAAAGNPAPDLVLTEKSKVTVLMDVVNCAGVPVDGTGAGGPSGSLPTCSPLDTNLRVLTPMGAQTQGAWNQIVSAKGLPNWGPALNPNVIYITDSPGATSQVIRYTINTDTQDSYSNFGILPDGTAQQYSFAFSVTQSPDGRMFVGDDPTAGGTAFSGHIYVVPAKAAADALGTPGAPATPPPPPSLKVGSFFGGGTSLPNNGVWLPGPAGTPGHLWISDGALGFCRIDAGGLNPATCDTSTAAPGQPAFDAANNFVYLPDQSTRGLGVLRVTFDPTTESIVPSSAVVIAPGQGLENQKTSGAALDPTTGALYLGFLNRNTTAPTEIARVNNPTSATPTVDFIANATRHKPIFTLAFIGPDLYVGNNGGLDWIPNAQSCAPGQCASIQLLNVRGPRGMASDGTDHIYMAGPAIPVGCPPTCPAAGALTTPVEVFTVSTGDLSVFSSQGTLADGTTLSAYEVVDSITVDPKGNVYVADDPNVLGTPTGQGRVFKIAAISAEPQPTLTQTPGNPTNKNKPTFAWQSTDASATFKCSLTSFGATDTFTGCPGSGSGTATYGTDATGKILLNGANPLLDGQYVFKVEGIGAAGTSLPSTYVFTVHTVAPVLTITSQPKSLTNVKTPTFAFTSDAAQTTFLCALTLAGGVDSFSPCTSPITYPAQADGAYTFTVKATDPAGNTAQAQATFTLDATPPTVTANPAGGLYQAPQSVVLTASEPATIYYTTDGTTPTTASTSGSTPVTVNVASSLTLNYFAVDLAGNVGTVVSQKYQIGALSLTQNPPSLTNSNTPTFAFTDVAPAATFQCSLVLQTAVDAFSPCTSPITYPAQADGKYRFVVQDNSGNSLSFLFTIDTTAPVISLTQNPPNPDPNPSATFAWTSNEPSTFQCSFGPAGGANAASACTSPVTFGNLADGSYLFTLQGTDLAGNTAALISYPFSVKSTAPVTITQAPKPSLVGLKTAQVGTTATVSATGPLTADAAKGVPVSISWAGTACVSGATNCKIDHYILQESVNGLAFATVALPSANATSVVRTLAVSPNNNSRPATTYRYQVQAVDTAGNTSPIGLGATFTVPDTDNSFNSSFNGSWSGLNLAGAFGGSVSESSTAGATANPANTQTATSFAVVSTLGPDRGIAQVKVDGQLIATVDLYAATQQTAQVVYAINGLAPGVTHQVQVVVTASHNAASTGSKVDYDAVLALK